MLQKPRESVKALSTARQGSQPASHLSSAGTRERQSHRSPSRTALAPAGAAATPEGSTAHRWCPSPGAFHILTRTHLSYLPKHRPTPPKMEKFMMNAMRHQAQHRCKITTVATELTQMLFKEKTILENHFSSSVILVLFVLSFLGKKVFNCICITFYSIYIIYTTLLLSCWTQLYKTDNVLNQALF